MGWICPKCRSENPFSHNSCAACRAAMPRRYRKDERIIAPLLAERLDPPLPEDFAGPARPIRRSMNAVMTATLCAAMLALPAAMPPDGIQPSALLRHIEAACQEKSDHLTAKIDGLAQQTSAVQVEIKRDLDQISNPPEYSGAADALNHQADTIAHSAVDGLNDMLDQAAGLHSDAHGHLQSLQAQAETFDSPQALLRSLLHKILGRNS